MSSISGFWAGTYAYPNELALTPTPAVNFDCELTQTGALISGQITESHAPGQMLVATLEGQLAGNGISFIKRYQTTKLEFLWEIAYSGQVSPKKDHITGIWQAAGRQGTFEMHRDAGQMREAQTRETADDISTKAPV